MGRKNKTKLLKHGSQSLNASTIGDVDSRVGSPDVVPEFEVLSSHLRELVATSTSTSDKHRHMSYMISELQKKDHELSIAKKVIDEQRHELTNRTMGDHNGDGDSMVAVHEETYSDALQNNTEELERANKLKEELIEEREKLVNQLKDTEERVARLQEEMKVLEGNQEQTNNSLEDSRQSSAKIIQELDESLKAANTQADSLRSELSSRQSDYMGAKALAESLQKELDARQQAHLDAKTQAESLQSELNSRQSALLEAKAQSENLQKELDARQSADVDFRAQTESLQSELHSRQAALLEAKAQAESLQKELDARQEAHMDVKAHTETLQSELNSRQVALFEAETQAQTLQKELDARQSALVEAKALAERLQVELDSRQSADVDFRAQAESLQSELQSRQAALSEAKAHADTLQKELDARQSALEGAKQEVDNIQTELESFRTALSDAKTQNESLQSDLSSRQTAYTSVVNDLNALKGAHSEQAQLLNKHAKEKNDTCNKLTQALKDLAESKKDVSVLLGAMELQRNERTTLLQQLTFDRQKLESRYEKINNGVQLIKKDFDVVKKNLIAAQDQNKELQQQLVASKADVKHYRDDGEACRAYIKKLEEKLQTTEAVHSSITDLQEEYKHSQEKLLNAKNDLASYEALISNLSSELQEDQQSEKPVNVLDAVRKLKESFRVEQRKQVFNLAAVEAKNAAHQKLIQENEELLGKVKKSEELKTEEVTLFEEQKKKLSEELESAKSYAKKLKKENNSALKKMKKLVFEKTELLKQNEENAQHSTVSTSNDSMISQASESMDALEESIVLLKTKLADSDEKLGQITKQLMEKEDENLDLHRTLVAYKTKIEENEQETVKNQKKISMMESRLSQLQRSADGCQKRYDEEISMLHQKIQATEDALRLTEESKSLALSGSEKLKQTLEAEKSTLQEEISQLKASILRYEADKAQHEEFVSLTEKVKAKIFEECKSLEGQLVKVQRELSEQEKSNEIVKNELLQLKAALDAAEKEKKESLEELSVVALKMVESERSQTEKESSLAAENLKLKEDVDGLRTQIMNQDLKIEQLSANITVSDQALEDLNKLNIEKINDYEKALQSEKAKSEILSKKLEEKTTESSDRKNRLKSKDKKLEEVKMEHERDSYEMRQKIEHLETDVAKAITERNTINTLVDDFKALVAEKEAKVEQLSEAKADLDLKQELLEKEIDIVNKKLEDAVSPKKDKILQLENRLEVMQTASQAQCKRLEEELSNAIASLEQSLSENRDLEEQVSELHQKSILVEELSANNEMINEELAKAASLRDIIAELEKQNNDIQLENAEERAGLVNELLDAKQKLTECEKQIVSLQEELQQRNPTDNTTEEDIEHEIPVQRRAIDEMFPALDPAVRQLVILLSENRNYSYGVLGLVIYGFLVHLYILFI